MTALDRLNRKYSKYGISFGGGIQDPNQIELLGGIPSDEEQQSILRDVGRSLMGGVQYIGETLDKPGRAFRGLLAGKPEELLNLLPFTDTLGYTDPQDSVSGRDLLEQYGAIAPNTPGIDRGDVAGFAAEVLLDPLLLVSGPTKGIAGAARKGGEYLTRHTPEVIRAVREGATGLVNIGLPGVPGISEFKPLLPLFAGEKGANALQAMQYGRLSPASALRGVFGSEAGGMFDPAMQLAADTRAVETARQRADSMEQLIKQMPGWEGLKAEMDAELKRKGYEELDRQVMIQNELKSQLEKAHILPDNKMASSWLSVSGNAQFQNMASKALGAAMLRGESVGLADMSGRTAAEEVGRKFPDMSFRGLSEMLGIGWRMDKANKSMMPVGIELEPPPGVRKELWAAFWKSQHGDVEETYRPFVYEATPTWSVVAPGEKLPRKPLPSEKRTVKGEQEVLAEPLPAQFGLPRVTRHTDGSYKLFVNDADMNPTKFDNLLDAKNAAAAIVMPDPLGRIKQIEYVGGSLPTRGLKSLSDLGNYTEQLMRSFSGRNIDSILLKQAKHLVHKLPEQHKESLARGYGFTLKDLELPKVQDRMAKDFVNWFNNGSTAVIQEADVPFAAMAHTVARIWESSGDLLRTKLGKKISADFDMRFQPDSFLKGVDDARGAWLLAEGNHSGLIDQLRAIDETRFKEMVDWGLNVSFLDDALISHWARRWAGSLPEGEQRRKYNELFGWMQLSRNDVLRDVAGGTGALRRMSLDAKVAGVKNMKADDINSDIAILNKVAGAEYLTKMYGVPQEKATKLYNFLAALDRKQVNDRIPIFNRDALTDVSDYMHTSDRMLAAVKSLHPMIKAIAERPGGTIPLSEAWHGMGLTPQGLRKLTAETGVAEDTLLDERMVEQMHRFMNSHTRAGEGHPLTGVWDAVHRMYKSLLTTPWPAKHARDFMSSMFESWTAGAASARGYKDMLDIMRGKLDEVDKPGQVSLRTLLNEMIQLRTIKKYGSSSSELLEFAAQMFQPGKTLKAQALEDIGQAFGDAKGSWGGLGRALNPFGGYMVDRSSDALTQPKQKFLPVVVGQAMGDLQDMLVRGGHYISLRRKGWSPMAAHESVVEHLHDWTELNRFEKDYARRGFTFYSWIRKNLPYQLEQLLGAPGGRTAQTVRAMTSAQEEAAADEDWIPTFIRQKGGIPLGPDEAGNLEYITGQPLGVADLNKVIVPSTHEWAQPAMRRSVYSLMSMLNPLITFGAEQLTGEQLYSGRPLKYLYSFTDIPLLDSALAHSPITRAMTAYRTATDDRKTIAAKIWNLASGFSVSQVSPEDIPKWQMVEMLDAARAIAKDNPHLRDFERVYVEAEDIANLSEDTKRMLAVQMQKAQDYRKLKQAQARGQIRMGR